MTGGQDLRRALAGVLCANCFHDKRSLEKGLSGEWVHGLCLLESLHTGTMVTGCTCLSRGCPSLVSRLAPFMDGQGRGSYSFDFRVWVPPGAAGMAG